MRRRRNNDRLYERLYPMYGTQLLDRTRDWDEETATGWQKWLYVHGALSFQEFSWRVESVLRDRRRVA